MDYEKRCKEIEVELIKCRTILSGIFPDKISGPFICGSSAEKDEYDLPNTLYICPAYGVNITAIYEKVKIIRTGQ